MFDFTVTSGMPEHSTKPIHLPILLLANSLIFQAGIAEPLMSQDIQPGKEISGAVAVTVCLRVHLENRPDPLPDDWMDRCIKDQTFIFEDAEGQMCRVIANNQTLEYWRNTRTLRLIPE